MGMTKQSGGAFISWLPSGGGSGGGGGAGSLQMFRAIVGQPNDPVAGTSTWVPAGLAGSPELLDILIDKVVYQSFGPSPDFTWDGTTLDISPSIWPPNGSTVSGWYVVP